MQKSPEIQGIWIVLYSLNNGNRSLTSEHLGIIKPHRTGLTHGTHTIYNLGNAQQRINGAAFLRTIARL